MRTNKKIYASIYVCKQRKAMRHRKLDELDMELKEAQIKEVQHE
jgi:hypothetical protein